MHTISDSRAFVKVSEIVLNELKVDKTNVIMYTYTEKILSKRRINLIRKIELNI